VHVVARALHLTYHVMSTMQDLCQLTIPTLGFPEQNQFQGRDLFASQRLAARGVCTTVEAGLDRNVLPIGRRWSPPAAGVLAEIMRPAQQLHDRLTFVSACPRDISA
jgi:hypothetical protein